jgi:hypothetical protein
MLGLLLIAFSLLPLAESRHAARWAGRSRLSLMIFSVGHVVVKAALTG